LDGHRFEAGRKESNGAGCFLRTGRTHSDGSGTADKGGSRVLKEITPVHDPLSGLFCI
jgi:hypothetical protein